MNEDDLEQLCIQLLQAQGYTYHHGPDIAPPPTPPNGGEAKGGRRASYREVVLYDVLRQAVARLNPGVPAEPLTVPRFVPVVRVDHAVALPDRATSSPSL